MYFYNAKKNHCSELASFPGVFPKTASANLLCCDGYVFAIGERFAFRYYAQNNEWPAVAPVPAFQHNPQRVRSFACLDWQGVASLGVFLYITVTYEDHDTLSCNYDQPHTAGPTWRYNKRTNTWDTVASPGYPRHSSCLLSCSRFLYAIGGLGMGRDLIWSTELVEKYDPSKDQWSAVSSMKVGISDSPRGVAVQEKIFIMDHLGSFQLYNTLSDQWQILSSLQIERLVYSVKKSAPLPYPCSYNNALLNNATKYGLRTQEIRVCLPISKSLVWLSRILLLTSS